MKRSYINIYQITRGIKKDSMFFKVIKSVLIKFLFLAIFFSQTHSKNHPDIIAIQPYGQVDIRVIQTLQEKIHLFYKYEVIVLPQKDIPEDLYYKPGNQYNAGTLIRRMKNEYPEKYFKILGVTERDIYHKKNNNPYYGIIGLGLVGGKTAIVSTFRLKKAGGEKEEKLLERVVKSSVHEIGHLLGLKHCDKTTYCIMQSARASVLTIDKKELKFCPFCLEKLDKLKL